MSERAALRPIIAPMTRADLEDVAAIERASFASGEPKESERVARLEEELGRPWARIWVARDGASGGVVGFLLAWHVADEVHLLDVATLPAFRRRGIALALMDHLLGTARQARARLVVLEVRRGNAGPIALYRRLGFRVTGLRKKYYLDGEDAIEMMLLMDPATGKVLPGEDDVKVD